MAPRVRSDIRLLVSSGLGGGNLEVSGLPGPLLVKLGQAHLTAEQWRAIFPVQAGDSPDHARAAELAMLGEYELTGGRPRFRPRVPFHPGVSYFARLDFDKIRELVEHPDLPQPSPELAFDFENSPNPTATKVERISPDVENVPENLLKVYVTFSAPMGRENPHNFIKLVQEGGRPVELPFVEVPQGLWNSDGTRLTLFFHPGRLKRGVGPNMALGAVLKPGNNYRLIIAGDFKDAGGRPLVAAFEKHFRVTAADRKSPEPKTWKFDSPDADSRQPLRIQLDEPIDEALLRRFIIVETAAGLEVEGEITVTNHQTRWRFTPKTLWAPGRFNLLLNPALEDLAGNRLDRLFEVDLSQSDGNSEQIEPVILPFTIATATEKGGS